jgi:hypothetical protein
MPDARQILPGRHYGVRVGVLREKKGTQPFPILDDGKRLPTCSVENLKKSTKIRSKPPNSSLGLDVCKHFGLRLRKSRVPRVGSSKPGFRGHHTYLTLVPGLSPGLHCQRLNDRA